MNITEILERGDFIKSLYPEGINNFFIGSLTLSSVSTEDFTISIHTNEKPVKEVLKWGQWDKNYNVLAIEMYGGGLRNLTVTNWQNNENENCICIIKKTSDNFYKLNLEGDNWKIEFDLSWLIPQNYTTYLL